MQVEEAKIQTTNTFIHSQWPFQTKSNKRLEKIFKKSAQKREKILYL